MGNKTSRQKKGLEPGAVKVGTCYKTIWSPDVGSDYLGKLVKKSKNKDASYTLAFEMGNEFPSATKPIFVKCACQKKASERQTKQTRKREGLVKEMKACVKAKCSAEQAAASAAEKKFNKTVKQQCKGLSKGKDWNSDWNKCKQEIYKKEKGWTHAHDLYTCKTKKCKDIGDAIHKTYYG